MIHRQAQDEGLTLPGTPPIARLLAEADAYAREVEGALEQAIDRFVQADIEGARDWRDTRVGGRFRGELQP